jgi:EAL and modified HD-GYP domain-containing signal transduction protein
MFKKIKSLIGAAPAATQTKDAFEQLNVVAPLKSTQKEATAKGQEATSFVCREAILDRGQRISGYEFALGRELQSRMLEKSALIRRVYDDAMLRNLAPLGVSSLLGSRFAILRLSVASLNNELLKKFANENTLVMLTPGAAETIDLPEIRNNLQYLEATGIKHGWCIDRPRPDLNEFLKKADIIEVETNALDGMQLKAMSTDFRAFINRPKLIASELQTSDDFNLCYHCGFDYFMGTFITSRENWHPAKSEINRLRVFEALNLIRNGAEFEAIANCMKTDPILTFKLLRYINSPGIGLLKKVDEISQALQIMGRDRFYRWLSLLLFDFNQPGYQERVMNEQALTRARFMEMLAGQGNAPASTDQLFMTGLFSLLDVMMDRPLLEVLKQVALPEDVAAALKGEAGAMHDALLLTISAESADPQAIASAAEKCGLDATIITGIMIDALAWSQQIASAGE